MHMPSFLLSMQLLVLQDSGMYTFPKKKIPKKKIMN